jgi:HAD superfamily hydrolase (TIGR01549 family)
MTYKYILFDWDGCLADSLPVWFDTYKQVFGDMGITISDQDIIDVAFYHWERLHEFGQIDPVDLITRAYEILDQSYDKFALHDGVYDTVTALKHAGVRVGVVTSSQKRLVVPVAKHLGVYHLFDTLVDRDDVSVTKPGGEPIERALEWLNGEKSQAIMIGDADIDIMAGKDAGVDTIWYNPPNNEVFHPVGHFDHLEPTYSTNDMRKIGEIVFENT